MVTVADGWRFRVALRRHLHPCSMTSLGTSESGGGPLSPKLVCCVVALAHRHVKLSVSERDTVGRLVELAKAKLREKYPYEKLSSAVVGVRSVRLDEGAATCSSATLNVAIPLAFPSTTPFEEV